MYSRDQGLTFSLHVLIRCSHYTFQDAARPLVVTARKVSTTRSISPSCCNSGERAQRGRRPFLVHIDHRVGAQRS